MPYKYKNIRQLSRRSVRRRLHNVPSQSLNPIIVSSPAEIVNEINNDADEIMGRSSPEVQMLLFVENFENVSEIESLMSEVLSNQSVDIEDVKFFSKGMEVFI